MFLGEYDHTIDSKGRVFMPVKLRAELGETFMVCKGLDNILCIYSMESWQAFNAKLSLLGVASDRRILRFFYSSAVETSLDAQGRLTVTPLARKYAGLEKDVYFVGCSDHIELWSAEAWDKEQSEALTDESLGKLRDVGL